MWLIYICFESSRNWNRISVGSLCGFAADIEIFARDRPRDNLYIDISCLFGFEYEQKQIDK